MNVALVEPGVESDYPPLSLASLAAYLDMKGHTARDFDLQIPAFRGRWKKELVAFEPGLIGITAMTPSIGAARQVAEACKQLLPDVPIVLIEDRTYTNTPFFPSKRERHTASRAALRAAFDKLTAEGVAKLYYVEGEHLLGDDGEAATDGSHPSDLGMMRQSDALEPVLRPLLETSQ